ncbi:MAG: hypothetical protein MJ152_04595, partial [Clostridia bacterium]|nr:hypothetical protein [Clostridia bacterium]
MKRIKKFMFLFVACMFIVPACLLFGGCQQTELQTPVSIVSIEKTDTIGLVDVYTIYFSDGTSSTFTVTNGKDGANGNNGNNGQNGINGADGQGLTIDDLYDAYKIENPDVTFALGDNENSTFFVDYLDYLFENYIDTADISTRNINKTLNSCMKVYTVFYEESTSSYGMGGSRTTVDRVAYCGSAVVYAVYEDYAYIITNYHVVFDDDANLKL